DPKDSYTIEIASLIIWALNQLSRSKRFLRGHSRIGTRPFVRNHIARFNVYPRSSHHYDANTRSDVTKDGSKSRYHHWSKLSARTETDFFGQSDRLALVQFLRSVNHE